MKMWPSKSMLHTLLFFLALVGSAAASATEQIIYFHNEPTGSAALATDGSGAIAWKETYRPYGDRLIRQNDSADNTVWFAGRPQEEGIGLSYFGARYYDTALGRFVSVDPAEVNPENLHSFNRYAYANNNPYRYVDPDGNSPLDIGFLAYDIGKLGMAIYSGAGVGAAAADVGMSLIGVASPVPGTGQALKMARAADKVVDTAKSVKSISTPYGLAAQSNAAAALSARDTVERGATIYRTGTLGKSEAAEAQFWSLEHPLSAGYASKYGLPAENVAKADFIEAATLKPGTPFVTRPAPGIGSNAGGGIEVVVPSGGVKMKWFTMP